MAHTVSQGTAFLFKEKSWYIYFRENRKGVIKICPANNLSDFTFKANLYWDGSGTVISIRTVPFAELTTIIFSFFFLVGLFLIVFSFFSGSPSTTAQGILMGLFVALATGTFCYFHIRTPHNIVIDYLEKTLNAKPVD